MLSKIELRNYKENSTLGRRENRVLVLQVLSTGYCINDMWKANNVEDYPIKIEKHSPVNNSATTRATTSGKLIEKGFSNLTKSALINDATHLWNIAPAQLKNSVSTYSENKLIKDFVRQLPM